MVRKWTYGINSYHKTASLILEDAPWWVFVLEDFVDFLSANIPAIPFPSIKIYLTNEEDIECNGGDNRTSLRDWYGDLHQWFHCRIHNPIFHFCVRRIRWKEVKIEYDRAKELFRDEDKEFWETEEAW